MFRGSYTALITPFKEGKIDWDAYKRFIDWQIMHGTHGVVPCGTTGESPTLSHREHDEIVENCVKIVDGRIPVIAGTGSNSTKEATRLTKHAEEAGANAALVIAPYYNKPTQEGLYQHFKAVHDETNIPIVIYNVPGRCVVDISDEVTARLAKLERIVGIKDASADLSRPQHLKSLLPKDKEFAQLSGEDGTAVEFNENGGVGCISVTANIAPAECSAMQQACLEGDFAKAEKIQEKLMPLHEALFIESSPGPVKYAASLMGLCQPEIRLPLVMPEEKNYSIIRTAMEKAGIKIS